MSSNQIIGLVAGLAIVVGGTSALFFLSNDKQPTSAQETPDQSEKGVAQSIAKPPEQPDKTAVASESTAKTDTVAQHEPHGHSHDGHETHHHDEENARDEDSATADIETSAPVDGKLTEDTAEPEPIQVTADGSQVTISMDEALQADMATKYDKAVIQLTGPKNYMQNQELVAGAPMTITDTLEDGVYKWEAVTVPKIPEAVKKELSTIRAAGDSVKMNEMMEKYREQGLFPTEEEIRANRISGSFRIHEGSIVDNTEEE